jgi:ketosteroid isomerase-like protein
MADSDAVLQAAVLQANETFYAAFAVADMGSMMEVWAHDEPVAVIHPGTRPVAGREQVLQSWRDIFQTASAVDIVCVDPQVQLHGELAIVLCQERINGYQLAASNTYRRTTEGWFLVLHQAGPVAAAAVAPARSSVVH